MLSRAVAGLRGEQRAAQLAIKRTISSSRVRHKNQPGEPRASRSCPLLYARAKAQIALGGVGQSLTLVILSFDPQSAQLAKVLLSDATDKICADQFRARGHTVDSKPGLSKEELKKIIGEYDGRGLPTPVPSTLSAGS